MQGVAREGEEGLCAGGWRGGRAARRAELFLILLGLECFPALALASCCLFPCSVPAPIPALKQNIGASRAWEAPALPLCPRIPVQQLWAHWEQP